MYNLLLAFVTGLTTGGLSCLAVQGGLLASSLAGQIEQDVRKAGHLPNRKKKKAQPKPDRSQFVQPIMLFLGAKLLAYTVLGFLLGMLGSVFQLSPFTRAILQLAIGVFMVGSALRILNVHPFFRYFVFEPPAFLRRRIRQTASGNSSHAAPIFLGLLTVLIPCGITQAMLAVALSTASPAMGAALMFAFTLGTSPVFFAVAYFAVQLGARLEKHFMRFAAVVVLLLGIYTVDTGLTLAGSPFSITRTLNRLSAPPAAAVASSLPERELSYYELPSQQAAPEAASGSPGAAEEENVFTITVKNYGYEPKLLEVPADTPIKLKLVSNDVYSCALAFVIPSLRTYAEMRPTDTVYMEIPPQKAGSRMLYSCSMGMFTGEMVFE